MYIYVEHVYDKIINSILDHPSATFSTYAQLKQKYDWVAKKTYFR